MKTFSDPKFLALYSGSVTAALLVLLLSGFAPLSGKGNRRETLRLRYKSDNYE